MPVTLKESVSEATDSVAVDRHHAVPWLKPYQFKVGDPKNPAKINPAAHRQVGSKNVVTIIEGKSAQLAEKYVKRALDDNFKDQGGMLRHVVDKFMPDVGRTDTVVNISFSYADVVAELQRRGLMPPHATRDAG